MTGMTLLRCLRVEILEMAGTALLSNGPSIVPARQAEVRGWCWTSVPLCFADLGHQR